MVSGYLEDSAVGLCLTARKRAPEGSLTRSRFLRAVTACTGREGVVGEAEQLRTMLGNRGSVCEEAQLRGTAVRACAGRWSCDGRKTTFPSILAVPELPCPKA
ncbi:PREDICTED: uncharacterized protein LOC103586878 [Galeopterus variegatus]|uniref:Uncharacterized protein LOC103586878 n=1 Tax=Galeopterus variegatus TaxID=482537 RepID=A0ABM0QDK6_GALVR|nr:PREDICTED: uncharacterized protein LOC103586878 [Galeopterus variegatus]